MSYSARRPIALIVGVGLFAGSPLVPAAGMRIRPRVAAAIHESPPLQTGNVTPPGQVRGEPDFDVFVSDPWIPTGDRFRR
ncbi:MAG: hypothetical protein U5K37_08325 [Natrialbaceae archaeon]|nr:hypothetical protein [Natrialbaceae archaeon]